MGKVFFYLSYRQPIELGHQTTHRYAIARAALNQQYWNVLQGELTTVVQAYRFFQTAAYRREKLRLASELADFNDRLLHDLAPRARGQPGHPRRRRAGRGREPGDPPAGRGRDAGLRQRA